MPQVHPIVNLLGTCEHEVVKTWHQTLSSGTPPELVGCGVDSVELPRCLSAQALELEFLAQDLGGKAATRSRPEFRHISIQSDRVPSRAVPIPTPTGHKFSIGASWKGQSPQLTWTAKPQGVVKSFCGIEYDSLGSLEFFLGSLASLEYWCEYISYLSSLSNSELKNR